MSEDLDSPSSGTVDPGAAAMPWGFWATTGLGIGVFAVAMIVQGLAAIPFVVGMMVDNPDVAPAQIAGTLESHAGYLIAATLASGVLGTLAVLLGAALKKGVTVRDYLAIRTPRAGALALWLVVAVVAVVSLDTFTWLLGRDTVPEWVRDVSATLTSPVMLGLALVVAAPLFEEALFRGFLFQGWKRSRLGVSGTILLTSAVWAATHVQYGAYEIAQIFVLGVVLGIARHRSATIVVPLAMHALVNLVATVQLAYLAG